MICSIDDGGSLADLDHIQPNTSLSGYFTYPISCDGTITSVSSYGFCFNSMSVVLLLIVTTLHDGGAATHAYHPLPVECVGSKINGTDYYAGNISLDNVGISVSSGNVLSVRFTSSCVSHGCLFLPAIANETGNYSLIFYNESIIPSENVSFSLFFSATIITGKIVPWTCEIRFFLNALCRFCKFCRWEENSHNCGCYYCGHCTVGSGIDFSSGVCSGQEEKRQDQDSSE